MKQFALLLISALLLNGCQPTPQEYFGIAALNCNALFGFAGNELQRDLAQPGVKLVDEKTMATVPLKRLEWVAQKLETIEQQYHRLQSLQHNTEADALINAAAKLYEYVLPVYRKEYKELAMLYDNNAPAATIAQKSRAIQQQYQPAFLILYQQVLTAGKRYAAQHGIQVQEVNPTPPVH